MKRIALPLSLTLSCLLAASVWAAPRTGGARRAPSVQPTRTIIYKTVGETKLQIFVFEPAGHKASDHRPAIVFFFGGGWTSGTPGQFYPHAAYLASRGMVAFCADYRVKSRQGVTPFECVADAKSAVRYVRAHAGELGVDPKRIAAGGGSAGGHIAACTGTVPGLDDTSEDAKVSSAPDAMVLFNPVLTLDPELFRKRGIDEEFIRRLQGRFGDKDPRDISPYNHVRAGQPPTIIFHGEADTTVPIASIRVYVEAAKKAGNRCELAAYAGKAHGFFNYGRGDEYYDTLRKADEFLASVGFLEGPATVNVPTPAKPSSAPDTVKPAGDK